MTTLQSPVMHRAITPEELSTYTREGYVLLPGLLTPTEAAALRAEVLSIMEVIGLGQTKLRQSNEYLAGGRLNEFVNSEAICQIASQLMEGPSTLYLPFTAVKSGNGGGIFNFHQDNQYTRFDGPGINLWFALNAMTTENGCLQVVPRSHLQGTLEAEILSDGHRSTTFEPSDFISVIMEPGDCIAFSRLTVHGSGPNVTGEPRVAYALQYHRDDVRAVWNGQDEPALLADKPRWSTGPVTEITAPTEQKDGH